MTTLSGSSENLISTPDRRVRVFVSSTLGELAPERSAARTAIESLHLTPIMFELSARNHAADRVYQDYLAQSDVFVGVYWESYGWIAPGEEASGLEIELRLGAEKPRLIYIKEPAPEREPRLTALIEEIWASGVATKTISGAEDLADQLAQDLALLLSDRFGRTDRNLPQGTVTFVFGDVEGSTAALDQHGSAYGMLLARFRSDAAEIVRMAGGQLLKTEGDGYFAVFEDADAALASSLEIQQTAGRYEDPGPLAVRVGLHTGKGTIMDGEYVGIDVHKAARLGAAAHGGQLILSSATRALITDSEPGPIEDLGWYRLRGIARPERLFRLTLSESSAGDPPRAEAVSLARIPTPLSSIVGREAEIEAISGILRGGARLLSLVGPGGIGKTRLAVAVAHMLQSSYRGSIGFVDLTSVMEPELVAAHISQALGRPVEGAAGAEDVIVDELRERAFLLILDNFEQVASAAPIIGRLLERLPTLQVLVTTRVALRVSGEQEFPVLPLGLPPEQADQEAIAGNPAVRLLVDRAHEIRPGLTLTDSNAAALAELVRRLDGIPLAIELAAARLRLMGPTELIERMPALIDMPAGATDLPDRQRTMRAAIDWSIRLLTETEKAVFRRMGIFPTLFSLDAAEAVAGEPTGTVMATLETLAAHSLVRTEDSDGMVQLSLLGPLHDYAMSMLEDSGEIEEVRTRHGEHYLSTLEPYPRALGLGLARWARRVSRDWPHLRVAVAWCMERDRYSDVAAVLRSVWPYVFLESRYADAMEWLDWLRPRVGEVDPPIAGFVLYAESLFRLETGDFEGSRDSARASLEIAQTIGDTEMEGLSHLGLGSALPAFGIDQPEIHQHLYRAEELFRERGDAANLAYTLAVEGSYQAALGDLVTARTTAEEMLELGKQLEALPIVPQAHTFLAFIALSEENLIEAEQRLEAACRSIRALPSREVLTYLLDAFAWLGLRQQKPIPAMTAVGASEGLRERLGLRMWPMAAMQVSLLTQLADSVTDPESQAARRSGHELNPSVALDLVRNELIGASAPLALT
jgi:predicted ATPase/class 3 adenylate cyclase